MRIGIASRVSRFAATISNQDVASGDPIIVHGIVANNTAAAAQAVTVRDSSSSLNTIMTINIPATSTVVIPILFLADQGINLNGGGANVSVTVFHSHTR